MKPLHPFFLLLFISSCFFVSCHSNDDRQDEKTPKIKVDTVSYTVDSLSMKSYVMYDENKEGKRPAIMVVHEWRGLTDYIKRRARELAELGYIAMAVGMYGDGRMG